MSQAIAVESFLYTALIRTQDSLPKLEETVASLRAQSRRPVSIVVVDSSTDPNEKARLAMLVDIVLDYPDERFNYSKAINLGVARCETPYVLIISSHVALVDPRDVQRAIETLQVHRAMGFYMQTSTNEDWAVTRVDRHNFNGRNGLSNTCAFLPTSRIRRRPFREEVFSAEDQEWAAHHFRLEDEAILRIRTSDLHYENPRWNELKYINEEISIAYFTCREKLGVRSLVLRLIKCGVACLRGRWTRAKTEWTIFSGLLQARSARPTRTSRYF